MNVSPEPAEDRRLEPPATGTVHAWLGFVPAMTADIERAEAILSASELEAAGRLVRPEDRRRYHASHVMVRRLLGRYLGCAPAAVDWVVGPTGKPHLAAPASLEFNLSHSGNWVAFGVAAFRPVGIDLEAIRTDFDPLELAAGQFSPEENAALRREAPRDQTAAFFRCWTRKEAYLKARGEGLGYPLADFAVAFGRGEPPAILKAADDPRAAERWSVFDLAPAPDHAGAVVVAGRSAALTVRRWA